MMKLIAILGTVLVTSFFLFPVYPSFLLGANTKMILAAVAVLIMIVELSRGQSGKVDKDFLILCGIALWVSFAFLFAVFYNNTNDYTYVSYIFSMLTWTGGAFTSVCLMRYVHGKVSVPLVGYYLVGVCVLQCVLALLIDRIPSVESFCSVFDPALPSNLKRAEDRLFGVGCGYDVGGMRMAAVLVIMGILFPHIVREYKEKKAIIISYLFAFLLISVVGNMIARTVTIGVGMVLVYWMGYIIYQNIQGDRDCYIWKWVLGLGLCSAIIVSVCYHEDAQFHKNLRFAFEGFFSLVETGKWSVHSNDILVSMYRWPETLKTWLVGDGYFFDTSLDPYYIGKEYKQYYMAIDVGYVRFVYYGGVFCLSAFIVFMCKAAQMCMCKFPMYKLLFVMLLLLQFLVWGKVASDLYAVFGIFIAMSYYYKGEELQTYQNEENDTIPA